MGKLAASLCLAHLALLASMNSAAGYRLFGPYPWGTGGETYYNKWGDIFHPGTPGGTISWSLMPDGTTIDPSFTDSNFSGVSNLTSIMNGLGYDAALSTIKRCLDRWSAAANIYFTQVSDSGAPFNGVNANPPNTGQIRFGAFAIVGGTGAVGYAPPPNGSSLEGDVLLNSNNTFFFDSSGEGEPIHVYNDFESLMMHEIGHALGMDHSETQAVMSANPAIFQYVNRVLDPDDIAGIRFLYGPSLRADFNHDNRVAGTDLTTWKAHVGATGATQTIGDANGDGRVDGGDFLAWQRELGGGGPVAISVPEPAELQRVAVIFAMISLRAAGLGRSKLRSAR